MSDDYEPIHIDAYDADWIKRGHWDIPAHSIPELLDYLDRHDMTVEKFKKLDVYRANVERLGWLRDL